MFQEETLQQVGRRQYEEPDGEFLELISTGNNTVTVLTRVDSDKVAPPIDPSDHTVSDLKAEIAARGSGWTEEQTEALLEAEQDGKNRKTAKKDIKEIYQ